MTNPHLHHSYFVSLLLVFFVGFDVYNSSGSLFQDWTDRTWSVRGTSVRVGEGGEPYPDSVVAGWLPSHEVVLGAAVVPDRDNAQDNEVTRLK